jgi:AraC family transcriptional regulator
MNRTWNGVTARATELHWTGGQGWHDITPDLPSLSIVLEEIGGRYEHRIKLDQPLQEGQPQLRNISLIPARMELWGYANRLRYSRVVNLDFDLAALHAVLGEEHAVPAMDAPRLMFIDDRLWQLGALLADECAEPHERDTLYGESLVVALCVDLRRLGSAPGHEEPDRKQSGLAPWQMRRLTEYMEAHLADGIHLKELAALSGLSLSHFQRAFRASFGMSPYRWHLNARVRRAQELLLESNRPLIDVALATGFADQSHFTKAFRRHAGVTPALWRRERWA